MVVSFNTHFVLFQVNDVLEKNQFYCQNVFSLPNYNHFLNREDAHM